jgi:hypothetical protein
MSRKAELEAVLSHIAPDASVQAIPEPDGSRIVVEVDGLTYRLSVGQGKSALMNYLLTGYPT